MLNRRHFIQTATGSLFANTYLSKYTVADEKTFAKHIPAKFISGPGLPVPKDKRAPFGWKSETIAGIDHLPIILECPTIPDESTPTHFRIAVGLDERDEKIVEVFLPKSNRTVGTMDLRFVSQFQVYEKPLTSNDIENFQKEGIGLRLTKGNPLEIFVDGKNLPAALQPHVLLPGSASPLDEFFARMNSLACVQQFGWMEGCVIDGLLDLSELKQYAYMKEMAKKHLNLFFINDDLIYEDYVCRPADNKIYGIEGTLPFAALAKVYPNHPAMDLAIKYWKKETLPNGAIQDGNTITSEGAYTVGYALAETAIAKQSEELMQLALAQVRVRQDSFFDGKNFWRTLNDKGHRGNINWARGIAWQILGLARTMRVAKNHADIDDLIPKFQTLAKWAINLQREDGLWSVFADEPLLTQDTAGSSGIAASLAIGVKEGWLGDDAKQAAQKTLKGLQTYLTSDGFLNGVSQSNKGGEGLQRSEYRSIYQMGMGLMAQLIAALDE